MNEKIIKISVITFCEYHQITPDFIYELQQNGLVELLQENDTNFISNEQLDLLEKYIRMHYELGINIEGIEVITRLLSQMEQMQEELNLLKRRL